MSTTVLILALSGFVAAGDPSDTPRKQSAIAPSLHELSDEEEAELDRVIDRFIDGDIGKLRGDDAKKARQEFDKLGYDAIPALIRGLNKAAKIEGSCPALVIGKKLSKMFAATQDPELLEFARENIGAGVGKSRHAGALLELRAACTARKRELARRGITKGTPPPENSERSLRTMTIAELTEAAFKADQPGLKQILTELEGRKGVEATSALGAAAASPDPETGQLARNLLERNLRRHGQDFAKERLADESPQVRAAAARAVADKGWKLGKELIDLLADDADAAVRESAHQALVKLNKGKDLGPDVKATAAERAEAVGRWREWWAKQN